MPYDLLFISLPNGYATEILPAICVMRISG